MAIDVKTSMRDIVWALIHGLHVEQSAMIDAASRVRDKNIARLYYEAAGQRGRFAEVLAAALLEPDTSAGVSRFVEQLRSLIGDLKETLTDDSPYALLGVTIRIEDAILDQYKRAVFHASETPVSPLLRRQFTDFTRGREYLATVRDQYASSDVYKPVPLLNIFSLLRQQHPESEVS
ncbi:MAG: hypothetical protein ABI614_08115 [Planctomycetota bacterium]